METKHDTTVVITVGRHEKGGPMGRHSWAGFQKRVQHALDLAGANTVFRPTRNINNRTGEGTWQDEVNEEAAAFVALIDRIHVDGLRCHLRALAAAYEQDAIGFIVADGTENFA